MGLTAYAFIILTTFRIYRKKHLVAHIFHKSWLHFCPILENLSSFLQWQIIQRTADICFTGYLHLDCNNPTISEWLWHIFQASMKGLFPVSLSFLQLIKLEKHPVCGVLSILFWGVLHFYVINFKEQRTQNLERYRLKKVKHS